MCWTATSSSPLRRCELQRVPPSPSSPCRTPTCTCSTSRPRTSTSSRDSPRRGSSDRFCTSRSTSCRGAVDLSVLDYLSDFICCLYGKPGAYGVVTMPFGVSEGINIFLAGFVPTENLRFRDEALTSRLRRRTMTPRGGATRRSLFLSVYGQDAGRLQAHRGGWRLPRLRDHRPPRRERHAVRRRSSVIIAGLIKPDDKEMEDLPRV